MKNELDKTILSRLNAPTAEQRLAALRQVLSEEKEKPPVRSEYANNHIHTIYSFSPYSPTAAVYFARQAGLPTAGIMDHDNMAGSFEFVEAGKIAGVATTVGIETRVSVAGTPLEGRFINSPDQPGVAYMAFHGVPHQNIRFLQDTFAPLRANRLVRNRKMVDNINELVGSSGIVLDFDADVMPLSRYDEGGAVTERHLMFALAKKIAETCGKDTAAFLQDKLGLKLSEKQLGQLAEPDSGYYLYDILGILKSYLVKKIYVPATDEMLHISDLAPLAKKSDSLLCYAYLGDVTNSVTGDKAAQKFEDDYLELLFDVMKEQGIDAVTYMPSRNTEAQLERVMKLCDTYGFMQISGEDINSPRQEFICRQLANPAYRHLIDATWALIEREKSHTVL